MPIYVLVSCYFGDNEHEFSRTDVKKASLALVPVLSNVRPVAISLLTGWFTIDVVISSRYVVIQIASQEGFAARIMLTHTTTEDIMHSMFKG